MRLAACFAVVAMPGVLAAKLNQLLLGFDVADELGVVFAAGAHEAGADGGDADAFVAELGVEAFGEADEGELGGGVGEHVGDGDLAADGGDVDDGGAARSSREAVAACAGAGARPRWCRGRRRS